MGATLPVIIDLIEAAITDVPTLYTEIKNLFSSNNPPTAEQFAELRAKVASENFSIIPPSN